MCHSDNFIEKYIIHKYKGIYKGVQVGGDGCAHVSFCLCFVYFALRGEKNLGMMGSTTQSSALFDVVSPHLVD
jgi:hypothetical protein